MIRVGLIGYGYAGRTFHAPLIRATPGLQLAVISSHDEFKVRADIADVEVVPSPVDAFASPSIDLVVIATPNDTHAPLAAAALRAGKHVVVDKPFALTLDEARDLFKVADQVNRLLTVFQNRRWDGDFLALKDLLSRSALGSVTHFESHFDRHRPQVRARWREQPGTGSGLWYDLGPHLVDQSLQLFGIPERVSANLAALRAGAATDDWAHVVLEYARLRVVLHASLVAAAPLPRFIVHGDRGSWVKFGIDVQEQELIAALQSSSARSAEAFRRRSSNEASFGGQLALRPIERAVYVDGATGEERDTPIPHGNYVAFYAQVRDALNGAGRNPVLPPQALASTAVVEAAIRAASERCAMNVPLTATEVREFEATRVS
jgi:predicted dehydrogenase